MPETVTFYKVAKISTTRLEASARFYAHESCKMIRYSRVFLQCQLWIVNYYISNEDINTGVSVVFNAKKNGKI